MKQYRTIVILLGVLLILGGIATWDEWMTEKEASEEEAKNKIAPFAASDVTKITYVNRKPASGEENEDQGPTTFEIEKQGEDWQIIRPVTAKADDETVLSFLTTIADYKYERVAKEGQSSWAEFGLQEPAKEITLTFQKDGSPQTFSVAIGEKAAVGYSVYFRTSSSESVLMGSQYLLVSTAKTLHDFRDKRLTYTTQNDIASFSYQRKGVEGFRLERQDGKFQLVSPQTFDTDHNAAMDFLGDVFGIKVTEYFDDPKPELQKLFQDPGITLTWTTKTGESSQLQMLYDEGKYYASFNPQEQIVQIPVSLNSKLSKEIIDFRNRRILDFDSGEVVAVTIDGAEYRRLEGDWFTADNYETAKALRADDQGENDEEPPTEIHVRSFLVDLEFAKTREFFPANSVAAQRLPATPEHQVVLEFKAPEAGGVGQRPDITVKVFGPDGQEHQFVKHSESEILYSVPNSSLDSLKKSGSDRGEELDRDDEEMDKAETETTDFNKG